MHSFISWRRKYEYVESIQTNISSGYLNDSGSNWGVWEMLRESLQNMADEAERLSIDHYNELLDNCKIYRYSVTNAKPWTHVIFRDFGQGVDFDKIFLLGVSGKRDTQFRGQKGEGESLSFLVAAREGIEKWMFSKDWAITARFAEYGKSGIEVLIFDLYKTDKPIDGTIWKYQLSYDVEDYIDNLGDWFPELSRREIRRQQTKESKRAARRNKEYKQQRRKVEKKIAQKSTLSTRMIITPRKDSRLYVKGIYVKTIHSLFSYNLRDVAINRDRSMVDDFEILEGIQIAFNSADFNKSQAQTYWKESLEELGNANKLEYRKAIHFINNKKMLKDAFFKVFGKKACVATDQVAYIDAKAIGFNVVELSGYVTETAKWLGLPTDKNVLGYNGDILEAKITKDIKSQIETLKSIGYYLGFNDYEIIPVKRILGVDAKLWGYFSNGKIYIMSHLFDGKRKDLVVTYIHEAQHGETGAGDGTRAFVDGFEKVLFELLMSEHEEARKLARTFVKI